MMDILFTYHPSVQIQLRYGDFRNKYQILNYDKSEGNSWLNESDGMKVDEGKNLNRADSINEKWPNAKPEMQKCISTNLHSKYSHVIAMNSVNFSHPLILLYFNLSLSCYCGWPK